MYLPGQLVPSDITDAEMELLKNSDSILRQLVDIDEFQTTPGQTPPSRPQRTDAGAPKAGKFDMDPAHLIGLDKDQLQLMLTNLGSDPVDLSVEEMIAQLSSAFKGQSQSSPEVTGTKLGESIKDSTKA